MVMICFQDLQKELMKVEDEKSVLTRECADLQERLKEATLQVSSHDIQKAKDLAHDLATLKGTTQAKDEEIKSLKRELERKTRLLESLNTTLANQQLSSLESPRVESYSRQTTPRGSTGYLFASAANPRKLSLRQLMAASTTAVSGEGSVSLATELSVQRTVSNESLRG